MKRLTAFLLSVLLGCAGADASAADSASAEPVRSRPENVILMIGDGMGFGQLMLARLRGGKPLAMESMPVTGIVHTTPADALVTDSAAAATALATGKKTKNGMCGVTPDGRPARSILEEVRDAGAAIGFVSTGHLAGATAAGFLAHVSARDRKKEISRQLATAGADVLAGGGGRFDVAEAAKRGTKIAKGAELLAVDRPPVVALLEGLDGGGRPQERSPGISLAAAMKKAVALLKSSHPRYFLVVEEDGIDSASHDHKAERAAAQVAVLDDAVAAALEIARTEANTLVVVTADHETGGVQITGGMSANDAVIAWATDDHTGGPVPLFAYGPGAEAFAGVLDNTEVNERLRKLVGAGAR